MSITNNKRDYLIEIPIQKFFYFYFFSNEWIGYLEDHGRKQRTIDYYRMVMRRVIKILGPRLGNRPLNELTEEDVIYLRDAIGGKESTKRSYLFVFGKFMEFTTGTDIVKRAHILWNNTEPDRIFIDKDQFAVIMKSAEDDFDKTVLLLGATLGLREAETANLKQSHIRSGRVTIHGKGHGQDGKIEVKDIPKETMRVIERYCRGQRATTLKDAGSDYEDNLLVCKNGPRRGLPTNAHTIDNTVQRLVKRSGIKFSYHVLRRFYCMTLANDCGLRNDLDTLRRMMRHSNISTTCKFYLNADTDRIAEAEECLNAVISEL